MAQQHTSRGVIRAHSGRLWEQRRLGARATSSSSCNDDAGAAADTGGGACAGAGAGAAGRRQGSARFVNPSLPLWVRRHEHAMQMLCFAALTGFFIFDAASNSVGTSNGRFVSLVHTLNGVSALRRGLPRRGQASAARFTLALLEACTIKFGAGAAVSLLLGETPVVLKGPRHLLFFVFGFLLVWLAPADVVHGSLGHSAPTQLVTSCCCALYKLRKTLFAVEAAMRFDVAVLAGLTTQAGNHIVRSAILWAEELPALHHWRHEWTMHGAAQGARAAVAIIAPDAAVTLGLWSLQDDILSEKRAELRLALLVYFSWKAEAFVHLQRMHSVRVDVDVSV